MVAGTQQAEDRAGGRHAAAEGEAVLRVLQRGEARFERGARRIASARILVAFILAQTRLRIGRGLEDRCNRRAGRGIRLLPGMNRARRKLHCLCLTSLW